MKLELAPTVQNTTGSYTDFAMFFAYSALYTASLILLLPYFLLNKEKYLSGLKQRLGFLPAFIPNGRPVIWVHCVSVGETNAAIPMIEMIRKRYPKYRVVISTTTKTGQELAQKLFRNRVDLVFYVPFDIPFIVNRVMRRIKPNVLLIMETEIWFNLLRSAFKHRSRTVIVNGRLSERSTVRYSKIRFLMKRVFRYVDLALMQTSEDAKRLVSLGMRSGKVKVTGNFKFDQELETGEQPLTAYFKERFGFDGASPVIVAASTHSPEERWILEAFKKIYLTQTENLPRLILVPRHPERFDEVDGLIRKTGLNYTRRTAPLGFEDDLVDVLLLDSIGELRSVYPLSDIVFVGGSLIPHGGQSILEPALARKTIITGNSLTNFESVAREFSEKDAFVRLPELSEEDVAERLSREFLKLLKDPELKERLARNAFTVMHDNRGATARTLKYLNPFLRIAGNALTG